MKDIGMKNLKDVVTKDFFLGLCVGSIFGMVMMTLSMIIWALSDMCL